MRGYASDSSSALAETAPGSSVGHDETLASDRGPAASSPREPDHGALDRVSPAHYTDRTVLAQGGMGRIVTARDRRLRRIVAIKELRVDSPELRARFEREALLTARLQHPSIVSIHEAGQWPSGEPFYAMKLVPGRSLDKVIADATSLEQRVALLPHVLSIADALAYAHQQRVIHRDLKPHNVIVGEFGETVVIDWGLAKDLDETSVERDGSGVASSDPAATEIGEVLGTPAYMPPEQAEGRPADERADVYAIGAILYHVLAGSPPYTGKSSMDVVDAVKRGPPVRLEDRQPGLPPDLLAIVERAMARVLAQRYPNARAIADDLRRFQAGQLVGAHRYTAGQLVRRWLRRHRRVVAVALVAVALLVGLGVISIRRIVREEERANAERVEVEKMMGFMLGDLKDKLEPIGRLDLLDAVAKQATGYYARRGDTRDDEDRRRRALALRNLGDVVIAQGDVAGALAAYQSSLADMSVLAAKDPGNALGQEDLAIGHEKIGTVMHAKGDLPAALSEFRASLAIRERSAARGPAGATSQRAQWSSHAHIADILYAQGDVPGALSAYRTSLAIAERLAASVPTNATYQQALSVSHSRVGNVLTGEGDLPGALSALRTSHAIMEKLVARDPKNAEWQRALATGHDQIALVQRQQGDLAAALTNFRAALAIRERAAARDPSDASLQRELSISHDSVGLVLRAQGNLVDALAAHRAALAISERLAAQDPDNAEWQRDLRLGLDSVGMVLTQQGDLAGALTAYRSALAIAEKLAAQDPTSASAQRGLAGSHDRVGHVLLAQGNPAAALSEFRASVGLVEKLVAKDPSNTGVQRNLATCQVSVGDALLAQGDLSSALAAYRTGLAIREKLAAQDPSNTHWQQDLSVSHESVGDVLAAQDDRTSALAEYRKALTIAVRLVTLDPDDQIAKDRLAATRRKVETCCKTTTKR